MSPFVRNQAPLWEEEPTDEELGWADDDSVPVNYWGEVGTMNRPRTDGMSLAEKLDFHSMPEPNSGCQLWLGTQGKHGHGQLYYEGSMQGAHRLAWRVAKGPIPEGMHVCHKCDNPYCINPGHLFVGTHADNMHDMIRKGRDRKAYGERARTARLTADDVRKIRADRRSMTVIAAEYGISTSNVSAVRLGQTWRHIPMENT